MVIQIPSFIHVHFLHPQQTQPKLSTPTLQHLQHQGTLVAVHGSRQQLPELVGDMAFRHRALQHLVMIGDPEKPQVPRAGEMLANHPVATFVSDGSSPTLEGSNIHFWELDPVWGFKLPFFSWLQHLQHLQLPICYHTVTPSIAVQSFNRPQPVAKFQVATGAKLRE